MEPLVFESLEPITFPVKLGAKEYTLIEASESAASRYKNAALKGTKVTENADGSKHASVDGVSETEVLLVSLCLFEKTEGGGQKSVDLAFLKNLPHRIIRPLFEKAEEISGLKRKETKEELRKRLKEIQDKLAKFDQEEESSKNS